MGCGRPRAAPPADDAAVGAAGGGKRLRPAFCYWSFVGAGGDPDAAAVIDAGAALEMLHAAALMHDDVIDGSARRHGTDTVHVEYAARHRDGAWRGDSEPVRRRGGHPARRPGPGLQRPACSPGAPPAAVAVFDEVRVEVNIGPVPGRPRARPRGCGPARPTAATAGTSDDGRDAGDTEAVARARRICRYKTAKYTVERPLHLGAALAAPGRAEELAGPLSAFGLPLGEAFQLRDDLLGVFGDPTVTGKPVGDDLREGKPTLLASPGLRPRHRDRGPRFSRRASGRRTCRNPKSSSCGAVIEATGARAEVEAAIERLAAAADAALGTLPILPEARRALGELAAFATGRDH